MVEPGELVGSFVVEVGQRQAWPFVGFCDNEPTPELERRLYIDADVLVTDPLGRPVDPGRDVVAALMNLDGLTVQQAETENGDLRLSFDDGSVLVVRGVARADTVGEPWWFGQRA